MKLRITNNGPTDVEVELEVSLRYLLFYGASHYPKGGWSDLKGKFTTVEEAREAGKKAMTAGRFYETHRLQENEWWMVVDVIAGEIVVAGGNCLESVIAEFGE